jgi:4-amino-4-deoxy-L-arabinose transferase-like glycosyltransferase
VSFDSVLKAPASPALRTRSRRERAGRITGWITGRPEVLGLLTVAGVLNLWGLSINGWANTYYSAAVRSMSTSWHDFLFASLDHSGLMTVDKPPLSLWVDALSVRVFGLHPLALLIPQALMGMAAVVLLYDLVRRRFGRAAGVAAGLVLATTPTVVAVSRHNNPDELLALCAVAALWFAVRGLETGRTRWLVLSGVAIGLGFETKMGVALMVVPGIAAAWMWVAPRGRLRALRQLAAGGAATVIVGGAWPLLVALTPAADRPWISGTSDNSILSLILGYNGIGRVAGQAGGPQGIGGGPGGGGTMFGGPSGIFRLLQSGLGDQAGWLLGFALVAGLGILVMTRLRRSDPRTGWLIAVGGAFLTTAVVFSFAQGIFHPYYVSLLAPFAAALIGGGVGVMLRGDRAARILAPLAIVAGTITELVVLGELNGQLVWARPLILVIGLGAALILALRIGRTARLVALSVGVAALLAAPATWAAETLGHAASATFPTGGPASAAGGGPGGGAFRGRLRFGLGRPPGGGAPGFAPPGGLGGSGAGGAAGGTGAPSAPGAGFGPPSAGSFGGRGFGRSFGGGFGGPGGGFGAELASLRAAIRYAEAHGGGAIGVASQSTAASAILSDHANVAGLGGFSGRESSVSVSWLAEEVRAGHLRWVVVESTGFRLPGDTRSGSQRAMTAVTKACRAIRLSGARTAGISSAGASTSSAQTIYDCAGRAAALLRVS